MYDPTQGPNLHHDANAFDDPIRKVGPDASATFDHFESNPMEWAGSEGLEAVPDPGRHVEPQTPRTKVRTDAIDPGVDDAGLDGTEDDEDEADEEDLDVDDEG